MSLNINADPEPFNKKELTTTTLILAISTFVAVVFGMLKVYPIAMPAGVVAAICGYLLFCDLLVLSKNVPNSPHQETRDRQQTKVNKALPLILIGLPTVCTILALIILSCYN